MVRSTQQTNKIRYLVLEPRHKKPLVKELYQVSANPRWVYLFADTQWQVYLKESPVLLRAHQGSPEYHWALQALKEENLIGLILESSKGLDAVVSWLRARLTVRIDGQREGLLRFYDPWIWHHLAPQTMPVAEVVERAVYWYGAPGQQRWLITENPEPVVMSPSPTLDEKQRQALNAIDA